MDDLSRRPVATPAYTVPQSARHQILVCKACKLPGTSHAAGPRLLRRLRSAIDAAGLSASYEVTGSACLAGCDHPCTIAWRAADKALWYFGAIHPDAPLDDVITFSRLYEALTDGWCSGADCPPSLCENTLARIPAVAVLR